MNIQRISAARRLVHAVALLAIVSTAAQAQTKLTVDNEQVMRWRAFVDALYSLHLRQLEGHAIRTEESLGGYADNPNFYREVQYFDAHSGQLLSQIAWETAHPETIHNIAVNRYDSSGRLSRDYYAGYLPGFRNAPVQTLINLHHHDGELHAFRQFDASGVRIYEQCSGRYFGEPFMISIEEDDLPINAGHLPADVDEALYASCFGQLPTSADSELEALMPDKTPQDGGKTGGPGRTDLERQISALGVRINATPTQAALYVERGDALFQLHDFDGAIADYSSAIKLDDKQDQAWFGRGMARGRAGQLQEGIADLSVYLARHPDSARAHTKRGVRYIWAGELDKAQQDLSRAIELDPTYAEAHDDLGVLLARRQRYDQAEKHFQAALRHDPSYQKAHHNLALVYHLTRRDAAALEKINDALQLAPRARDSLLLKAAILDALGRVAEAKAIEDNAEFLPEGNWSERFPVR